MLTTRSPRDSTRTAPASPRRAARLALVMLPSVIVLVTVGLTTLVAAWGQERSIREDTADDVFDVAESLAQLQDVRTTLTAARDAGTPDEPANRTDLAAATSALQPLADLVQSAAGVYYVVITDDEGVRITHPLREERGVRVDTTADSVLEGTPFLGTEVGASGPSLRAKVPVRDAAGDVVGMVAVGVLESSIASERDDALGELLPWTLGALVIGTLASSAVAAAIERRFRRADAVAAEQERMIRTTAALREQAHEFSTRLHVIHGLVSHGDTDEALSYIDGVVPVLTRRGDERTAPGASLVSASIEALRGEIAALGARLEVQMDLDIPIDESVLLVFANLCRNAAEAGAARVRCTLESVEGLLLGAVEDDGPGLDPRDAERLFSRGYTSKPDATGAGRGLGLDLVRRAVTERGGTVVVGRSRWGGARFEFEMSATR